MKNKILIFLLFCRIAIDVRSQYIVNPVLSGFYPDPALCQVNNDYYMVSSTFAYFPGLPIFHSKDLINWELLSYALNRLGQLQLEGAGTSRGIYAPDIQFHDGIYYIVCTYVDKLGNFVITSTNPKGPWSDPITLPEVNGIDPSLFFDDNGSTYLLYNSIAPENKPLYEGHRTIRIVSFDPVRLKTTGTSRVVVNGGADILSKPVWIEGPHLFKKDGWYYLICAEGGTGYNHSEVVFRSRNISDSLIPYSRNPILTQRQLNPQRANPVSSVGHADFVKDIQGNWWAVFLGCRPYEGDYYNTGRETFMAPVRWQHDWPVIDLGGDKVQYRYPIDGAIQPRNECYNGNYIFHDDFKSPILSLRYAFLRTPREQWYSLTEKPGNLTLRLRQETCEGLQNPSFIGFRQGHLKGYATTAMQYQAQASNEMAGMLVFQNEKHYYYLCKSDSKGKAVVQLCKPSDKDTTRKEPLLLASRQLLYPEGKIWLRIQANGNHYNFYYKERIGEWKLLAGNVDARFLSTAIAGGFVGTMYALYATSNGKPSGSKAHFDYFENVNNDDIYKK